jgi:hypothetical protein
LWVNKEISHTPLCAARGLQVASHMSTGQWAICQFPTPQVSQQDLTSQWPAQCSHHQLWWRNYSGSQNPEQEESSPGNVSCRGFQSPAKLSVQTDLTQYF